MRRNAADWLQQEAIYACRDLWNLCHKYLLRVSIFSMLFWLLLIGFNPNLILPVQPKTVELHMPAFRVHTGKYPRLYLKHGREKFALDCSWLPLKPQSPASQFQDLFCANAAPNKIIKLHDAVLKYSAKCCLFISADI